MNEKEETPVIINIKETKSTNHYIREIGLKEKLPEGSVVVADFQTAGRGQIGNVWESEEGKNLTFSLILYPEFIPSNQQFLISQIAALSVKETLDAYVSDVTVKWPNDVYWKDKKICGMLIENDLGGRTIFCSIIGIGLNLNQQIFYSDAPNPVSLTQITGEEYDRQEVLNRFLHIFYAHYLQLLQENYDTIRKSYRAALYRRDGYYLYSDADSHFEGRIYDIESTGHLVLQMKDGTLRRYAFKEVSYIKK